MDYNVSFLGGNVVIVGGEVECLVGGEAEYFTAIRSPREQPPAYHHKEHSCRHQQTAVIPII